MNLDFTAQQLAELRRLLGGAEPTPDGLVAIAEAAVIIEAEAERLGLW